MAHSAFSLEALEALLQENQRLKDRAAGGGGEGGGPAVKALQHHLAQQSEVIREQVAAAAAKKARIDALEKRVAELEAANGELGAAKRAAQDELRKAEQLQLFGKKALDDLKQQFEILTKEAPAEAGGKPTGPSLEVPSAASDPQVLALLGRVTSAEALSALEGLASHPIG